MMRFPSRAPADSADVFLSDCFQVVFLIVVVKQRPIAKTPVRRGGQIIAE